MTLPPDWGWGHVVWMGDAWRVGPGHILSEWLANLRALGALGAPQAIPAAVLVGLALLVAIDLTRAGSPA